MNNATPNRLTAYGLYAALLSAAGLPIYIHAPKFYVDQYGVSLAALGSVLFGLRLLDVVQDPLFGKLSEILRHKRGMSVLVGTFLMALGMVGLFAVTPPVAPLLWFGLMLTLVFSAFSFLTINFYAQGVTKAGTLGEQGHLQLFAVGFCLLALMAVVAMQGEWAAQAMTPSIGVRAVLADPLARRLLLIALVNAAPVAVSSTLFLFFVESRLDAPGYEGMLLLLFFLSAAVAAPVWGKMAERFGPKRVLLIAMVLSIVSLGMALLLGSGDWALFAIVCLTSGAALGADLTLLPAIFAARMEHISPSAAEGFGLWAFVSKFTLAFAAVVLLPALDRVGFESGAANSPEALTLLTLLYAGVPCALKLVAIALLATTRLEEI